MAGSRMIDRVRVAKSSNAWARKRRFWIIKCQLSSTVRYPVAKWPCQKRVIFSSSGSVVLIIRSSHQRRIFRSCARSRFCRCCRSRRYRSTVASSPRVRASERIRFSSVLRGRMMSRSNRSPSSTVGVNSTKRSTAPSRPEARRVWMTSGVPPNPARRSRCAADQ